MSENWHKRHAMVLAGQLPENAPDANAVNRELQRLVDNWLYPAEIGMPTSNKVISLVRDQA